MPKIQIQELFSIPLDDDRYLIYAPLCRTAFVCNKYTVNFIARLKKGVDENVSDSENEILTFLRQVKILDTASEKLPVTTHTGTPLPTSITLLLTTACNLHCSYCCVSAGDTKVKSMSLDTAKRGIDFIVSNAQKKNRIAKMLGQKLPVTALGLFYFGGGEPTAHWSVLTESFAYAQQKAKHLDLPLKVDLTTNGVLTNTQIDWFIDHFDSLQISFDGLPSIQDEHRRTAGGKGSSQAVMHTFRRFDAAHFPYLIKITLTETHYEHLSEAVTFLADSFTPRAIQVEPAMPIGRGEKTDSSNPALFIKSYINAHIVAREKGIKLEYSPVNLNKLSNHYCGTTQDMFVLSPDGNVSACYNCHSEEDALAHKFFYGKPFQQGYTFDMPVLEEIRTWGHRYQDFCKGCIAKWHCAGDCHYNTFNLKGEGEFTGTERCHITRELTKHALLIRIVESDGPFWHEDH